jgi:hypothetical protein
MSKPTDICSFCGKEYDAGQYGTLEEITKLKKDIPMRMLTDKVCFQCGFWFEKIDLDNGPWKDTFVIANHYHYHIGDEVPKGARGFIGSGGYRYTIEFFDGRVVESNNLWHQGEVPEIFWEKLPNNAVFNNKKK